VIRVAIDMMGLGQFLRAGTVNVKKGVGLDVRFLGYEQDLFKPDLFYFCFADGRREVTDQEFAAERS